MKSIQALLEQTDFLLQKHRESAALCRAELDSLLALTAQKRDETQDVEDKDILEAVYESLATQSESIRATIEEDIKYLEEQVAAMRQVSTMPDGPRKQELVDMLLVEDGDLRSMEEFKKEVEADADESRRSFVDMVKDIKQALNEGLLEELEAMLESMDEDEDDDSDDHDEDGCCDEEEGDDACCNGDDVNKASQSSSCCKEDNWLASLASGKVYDVEEEELEEMPLSKKTLDAAQKKCCRGDDEDCGGNCVCRA
jgi:hypothetical protein